MAEALRPKLDSYKAESDPRALEYRRGLRRAVEAFQLTDSAFRNDRYEVILGAIRLLSGYDVDPVFTANPQRNLFALAIADAWLSTEEIREKKTLLDILKLVATGLTAEGEFRAFSNKVRVWSNHESLRGTEFDPAAESGNSHREYIAEVKKFMETHYSPHLTQEALAVLADWGPGSLLHRVREKLGVHPENETSGGIVVLNRSWQQMQAELGVAAFRLYDRGEQVLVFDREYWDSFEHEYAHSQSESLSFGFMQLLFRGLDEALTENATSSPETYPQQRRVLRNLLASHPEYEELLYRAYVGHQAAKLEFLSRLANDFGLTGLLTLARLSPIDNPKMSGQVGQTLYIEPDAVRLALGLKKPEKPQRGLVAKLLGR
jgi:hypothetical protein